VAESSFAVQIETRKYRAFVVLVQHVSEAGAFNVGTLLVSGKKFVENEAVYVTDPTYLLYQPDTLLFLTRNYRTWGPFHHRSNLVRLTITVRKRNEAQLVVRASAQFYLQPVENPVPYQMFFRSLEQALFLQGRLEE
jgi:hypothetical protein